MLSLIKIKDIHQGEDTDHIKAIVRTSPWATWRPRARCWWPLLHTDNLSLFW